MLLFCFSLVPLSSFRFAAILISWWCVSRVIILQKNSRVFFSNFFLYFVYFELNLKSTLLCYKYATPDYCLVHLFICLGFRFQKACVKYGVPDVDLFQAVDLMERKNIAQVTNTIFAIGRTVFNFLIIRSSVYYFLRRTQSLII